MILQLLFTDPTFFFIWVASVTIGLSFHEFAHALAAYKQGDSTAADAGRLTLNPLKHIDWLGFVLLITIGFGWGKPTPVNPMKLKNRKWGSALVSLAGPLSNAFLIVIFGAILWAISTFTGLEINNLLVVFLVNLIQINLILGLFNLIPIPPLDGSKMLYPFIPAKNANIILTLERYGFFILIIFLVFFSSTFFSIFQFFYNRIILVLL